VFSDGNDVIVDFDSRCQVAKPLKLMMVLSKINEIPYAAILKLGGLSFLAQFCCKLCYFLMFCV
jgi:hypothetical protein